MSLVDKFTTLYNSSFSIKNRLLLVLRVPKVIRFTIFILSNATLPMLLRCDSTKGNKPKREIGNFTVCLTSFPQRIDKLHLVICTLLLQTIVPKKITLFLSQDQFSSLSKLPKKLLAMQDFGLTIQLVEGDLRAYKKYFYQLTEHPTENFIIVDDDIFYPSVLLEHLYKAHLDNPTKVCANRCARIEPQQPYRNWKLLTQKKPVVATDIIPTGCGGVFYPAGSLSTYAIDNKLFSSLCPDADDIWLNVSAYLQKTEFLYTGYFIYYLPVIHRKNINLHAQNVANDGNDKKFYTTRDYFLELLKIDVLDRLRESNYHE
jgi:hypothetical protein